MTIKNPNNPNNLYPVANATATDSPLLDYFAQRDPTVNDTQFGQQGIQKKWLNTATGAFWMLQNYTTSGGVLLANWIKVASTLAAETLTGDDGIPVSSVANNINIIGDSAPVQGAIRFTSGGAGQLNAQVRVDGTSVTINGSDQLAAVGGPATTNFTVDAHSGAGTNPVLPNGAGNITVHGLAVAAASIPIQTDSKAANAYNIEVQAASGQAASALANAGLASFNNSQFAVDAAGFVSLNAVAVATTYNEDSGSAVPAANILIIAGGTGIATSGTGNTVTITATGAGFKWQTTSISLTLAKENGYFCISPGGTLSLALPAVSVIGDSIKVVLDGATSFVITQPNAGSVIHIGTTASTVGATGTLTCTETGDTVELVCQTANAIWNVVNWAGNPTPA